MQSSATWSIHRDGHVTGASTLTRARATSLIFQGSQGWDHLVCPFLSHAVRQIHVIEMQKTQQQSARMPGLAHLAFRLGVLRRGGRRPCAPGCCSESPASLLNKPRPKVQHSSAARHSSRSSDLQPSQRVIQGHIADGRTWIQHTAALRGGAAAPRQADTCAAAPAGGQAAPGGCLAQRCYEWHLLGPARRHRPGRAQAVLCPSVGPGAPVQLPTPCLDTPSAWRAPTPARAP